MQRWARALLSEKVRLEGGRLKTRDDRAQLLPACQFPVQLTKEYARGAYGDFSVWRAGNSCKVAGRLPRAGIQAGRNNAHIYAPEEPRTPLPLA